MTRILFERAQGVYLPEISAYISYLKRHKPHAQAIDSADLPEWNPRDFDIVWRFMGLDRTGYGNYVVHEYNSLSAGFCPLLKNKLKRTINAKPHRRVFLSPRVAQDFAFDDNVPFRLRDMGVDDSFFTPPQVKKTHDFIYAGSFNRGPETTQMLAYFSQTLTDMTLLAVGEIAPSTRARYAQAKNITFTGRVAYSEVPRLIASARYGLNILPDRYPYNVQTATKVLEYCAAAVPVVSLRYAWIDSFSSQQNASFFWLKPDFSNLTAQSLSAHKFRTPDVASFKWDHVIERSGVFDFI